jgi:hypothetical protein
MSSISGPAGTAEPVSLLRYLDVALLVLAAPIMLLIGVPAAGYGVGAGAWIVLRAVGVLVERWAAAMNDARQEIGLRLAYMLGRLFLLALAIVFVRQGEGRNAGVAALVVIVFAFTVQLGTSALTRPRSR